MTVGAFVGEQRLFRAQAQLTDAADELRVKGRLTSTCWTWVFFKLDGLLRRADVGPLRLDIVHKASLPLLDYVRIAVVKERDQFTVFLVISGHWNIQQFRGHSALSLANFFWRERVEVDGRQRREGRVGKGREGRVGDGREGRVGEGGRNVRGATSNSYWSCLLPQLVPGLPPVISLARIHPNRWLSLFLQSVSL